VVIHRADCPNIKDMQSRLIDVVWEDADMEHSYDADILIYCFDRNFLITDIVTVVSQLKAPLINISAKVNKDKITSTVKLTVQVENTGHLESLMANLRKVDSVRTVSRISH
jgi:GTP pyrophosphokinase